MIWLLGLLMLVNAAVHAACMVATASTAADGAAWVELCSPDGVQWVSLQTGEIRAEAQGPLADSGPVTDAHMQQHCDGCCPPRTALQALPVAPQALPLPQWPLALHLPAAQTAGLHDLGLVLVAAPTRGPPRA